MIDGAVTAAGGVSGETESAWEGGGGGGIRDQGKANEAKETSNIEHRTSNVEL